MLRAIRHALQVHYPIRNLVIPAIPAMRANALAENRLKIHLTGDCITIPLESMGNLTPVFTGAIDE